MSFFRYQSPKEGFLSWANGKCEGCFEQANTADPQFLLKLIKTQNFVLNATSNSETTPTPLENLIYP
jgi:hypothetical protein